MWLDYADDVAECKVTCRFSCNRVTIQENDTHCDTHVSRLITPVLQVLPALDRLRCFVFRPGVHDPYQLSCMLAGALQL